MKEKNIKKLVVGGTFGVLALTALACGVWPVLLLMFIGIFAAVLLLTVDRFRPVPIVRPMPPAPPVRQPEADPTVSDLQKLAYAVIVKQVTALVIEQFPDARWIWETPDAQQRICRGEPVCILLNRAGGYRRACVEIQNLQAVAVRYEKAAESLPADDKEQTPEPAEENYELLAFEWVDAHAIELNVRCNEAIGQKLLELVLLAEELPARESWPDICKELVRAGIKDVKCVPEGIKIILTQ